MQVSVSTLRSELKDCIARLAAGEEVIVTDRGVPVARLVRVDSTEAVERLADEGLIGPAKSPTRPTATGGHRVRATGPVADLVSEQRR